jgi:hypothetical protein
MAFETVDGRKKTPAIERQISTFTVHIGRQNR